MGQTGRKGRNLFALPSLSAGAYFLRLGTGLIGWGVVGQTCRLRSIGRVGGIEFVCFFGGGGGGIKMLFLFCELLVKGYSWVIGGYGFET